MSKQYVCFDPRTETSGRGVAVIFNAISSYLVEDARIILARCGIEQLDPDGWYSGQAFLDAFKIVAEQIGENTVHMIGKVTPSTALWPPEISTVEQALASINVAYHMNHRNGEIGNYVVQSVSANRAEIFVDCPYPCAFDMGLLEATVERFVDNAIVFVRHDDSGKCRAKGDEYCRYIVEWVSLSDKLKISSKQGEEILKIKDTLFSKFKIEMSALQEQVEYLIKRIQATDQEKNEIKSKMISNAKMTSLGEMAGGIAHEINNPLTIIGGICKVIEQLLGAGGEINRTLLLQYAQDVQSTVGRISQIITGLRAFARDGTNDRMSVVDMARVIDKTLHLCGEKFKVHNVEILVDVSPGPLMVLAREVQLSQVLLNLLNNAYDALEKQSEKWIKISCYRENEFVVLSVMDSGNGISESVQEKIMQPFFTTKEVGRGTGLGLSISQGIINEHNGVLLFDKSAPNTRFLMKLPAFVER